VRENDESGRWPSAFSLFLAQNGNAASFLHPRGLFMARGSWPTAVCAVLITLLPSPVAADGIAFRLIIGAPPDPNYQEVGGDGNAALPPRGFSPGYGYPRDYMHMPSLVITNQRLPMLVPVPAVPFPDAADVPAMAVLFRVRVPADAEVWFSGQQTVQRGSQRRFVTPPLEDGQVWKYEVRARWKQDGKDVEQTRRIAVHAGDRVTVDFLSEGSEGVLPPPRKVEQP
jgi:uncharacterized protein (TIGR03000 family)